MPTKILTTHHIPAPEHLKNAVILLLLADMIAPNDSIIRNKPDKICLIRSSEVTVGSHDLHPLT